MKKLFEHKSLTVTSYGAKGSPFVQIVCEYPENLTPDQGRQLVHALQGWLRFVAAHNPKGGRP